MKIQRRIKIKNYIPVVSMADIAFLLLIFFIVAVIPNIEPGLPIELPKANEIKEISSPHKLNLWIDSKSHLLMDKKIIELEEIAFLVTQKVKKENFLIIINADKNCRWEIIAQVFEILKSLQIKKIHFVATEKNGH